MVHTPGPWTTHPRFHHDEKWTVTDATHEYIAAAYNEANAHLIAAAPDLLAALYRILEELPAQSNDHQWMEDGLRQAVEAAGAALAKAEPPS